LRMSKKVANFSPFLSLYFFLLSKVSKIIPSRHFYLKHSLTQNFEKATLTPTV
jgi:hypothetical protein